MMVDRLEQKLPIDAVEVTLDVDVEHPVVAPAALAGRAHGVNRPGWGLSLLFILCASPEARDADSVFRGAG